MSLHASGWWDTQAQTAYAVPYAAILQWSRKFKQALAFADKPRSVASEEGCLPITVPGSPRKPEYWSAAGWGNARFISAALQAEAVWIAEHEKLLWQRLREKSL